MNRVFSSSSLFFLFPHSSSSSPFFSSLSPFLVLLPTTQLNSIFPHFFFSPSSSVTHVIPVKNNSTLLRNSAHSKSNNIPVNTSACTCAWFISDDRNQRRKTAKRKKGINLKENLSKRFSFSVRTRRREKTFLS